MTTHSAVSYFKSTLRIIGYAWAVWIAPYLFVPLLVLTLAEVLGIAEELPGAYKGTQTC